MFSSHNWNQLLESKKQLVFIHTPKCGGTYVNTILQHLKLSNVGHSKITDDNTITFTVVREPIERYESLLNYRLRDKAYKLLPNEFDYVYEDTSITLNDIVSSMTDEEILGFRPYSTLTYWAQDVDIIITIEHLPKLLHHFGYTYDINLFEKANVSPKLRGKFNSQTITRLKKLYYDDILLYNKVINSDLPNN
jgi:hypothetical protein